MALKNAEQVEQDELSCSEKPCAEGDLFKIDLHVQEVPKNAVLEDQGRMTKIQNLVNTLRTQYRTESVIANFCLTGKFNRFTEETPKTSKIAERSNCLNWEKFPRKYSAHHVHSAGQKFFLRLRHV